VPCNVCTYGVIHTMYIVTLQVYEINFLFRFCYQLTSIHSSWLVFQLNMSYIKHWRLNTSTINANANKNKKEELIKVLLKKYFNIRISSRRHIKFVIELLNTTLSCQCLVIYVCFSYVNKICNEKYAMYLSLSRYTIVLRTYIKIYQI